MCLDNAEAAAVSVARALVMPYPLFRPTSPRLLPLVREEENMRGHCLENSKNLDLTTKCALSRWPSCERRSEVEAVSLEFDAGHDDRRLSGMRLTKKVSLQGMVLPSLLSFVISPVPRRRRRGHAPSGYEDGA